MVGPEQIIIKQKGFKIGSAGKTSSIFGFMWRHKLLFITLFFLLPTIITTINLTIKEKNPLIPVLVIGGSLFNSDNNLAIYTDKLKENPNSLFILNENDVSIGGKLSFFFNRLYLTYLIISAFWFLFINLKIYTFLWSLRDVSRKGFNFLFGFTTLVVIMLFTNFIMLTINLAEASPQTNFNNMTQDNLSLVESLDKNPQTNERINSLQLALSTDDNFFKKASIIFLEVIPFKGVVKLIMFTPQLLQNLQNVLPKAEVKVV